MDGTSPDDEMGHLDTLFLEYFVEQPCVGGLAGRVNEGSGNVSAGSDGRCTVDEQDRAPVLAEGTHAG